MRTERRPRVRKLFLLLIAAGLAMSVMAAPVRAAEHPVNTDRNGVAVKGYDTVAYFTAGKPIKGNPDITYKWHGAIWQFSTEHNRELFKNAPEKYAPQYGGY
jgi:YHS domain-containing protein